MSEQKKANPNCFICGGEGWYEVDQWQQRPGGAVMLPAIVTCECVAPKPLTNPHEAKR